MKPDVSIIIVHYRVRAELFNCLSSIAASTPKISYEVIVVDNDERQAIEKALKKRFPWVRYVRSPGNIGFGAASNLGEKVARGQYLFFLNPDTLVTDQSIDILVNRLKKDPKIGIAAPQMLDEVKRIYPLQGTGRLTPITALVAHSLVNRILPTNPVSRKFWILDWNRESAREVETIEGSAFLMRKLTFDNLGGFDEKFFLYFEETDLCARVRIQGLRILVEPKAKIIHLFERSTKDRNLALNIFRRSRSYYFRKHFGLLKGGLIQALFWVMDRWKPLAFILVTILVSYLMT